MKKKCIFCRIVEGEIPSNKIYENEEFFSIPDANPVCNGHSLVISKKHFNNILDIPDESGPKFLDALKKTSNILMKKYGSDGFNLVNNNGPSAGQIVNHIHFHIFPRNKKDGNVGLKFIPGK